MTTHVISTVRGNSLARQLAGLGLVRTLSEQADPALRCWFDRSALVIDTAITDLTSWLVDSYEPTPVLNPWNEGSGFGAKDKAPKEALAKLLSVDSSRLDAFRRTYDRIRPIAERARQEDWTKAEQIAAVRNRCPDKMLPWMDAAVVALDVDDLAFPPLLGSGGNDGRLEFSTNFHQRLLDVLPLDARARDASARLAADWLGGGADEPLTKAAVGQFDPGAAGTPNSSPFGAAESLVNPWEFVLMIEGTPLFASAPVRRLDSQASTQPRAAMTFMTEGSEAGTSTGTSAEEKRGEVWVPWWEAPLSYAAIRQLFGEGRAVWRGRTATRSGQMYLATASRGVSQGVSGFDRYSIVKRNGLAFSAVLTDEVGTSENSAVLVVAEVEDWPDLVGRRKELPATARTALRRFDEARVELVRATSGVERVRRVRDLLATVTDMELAVGRSGRTRDDVPPWPRLRGASCLVDLLGTADWVATAGAPEFRIALSLASLMTTPLTTAPRGRTMREVLLPIDPPIDSRSRPTWRPSAVVGGFGQRPLVDVLSDVLMWLVTTAPYAAANPATDVPARLGIAGPSIGIQLPTAALHAWVHGSVDEAEVAAWFHALLALDWREHRDVAGLLAPLDGGPVDPVLATLRPFRDGARPVADRQGVRHALTAELVTQLVGGHPERAHRGAQQRLRQLGYIVVSNPVRASQRTDHGKRLAAALLPRAPVDSAFSCVAYRLRTEDADDKSTEERT